MPAPIPSRFRGINRHVPQARGLRRAWMPQLARGRLADALGRADATFSGGVARLATAGGLALDVPNTAGAATAAHYVDTGILPTATPCALFVRFSFDTVPAAAQLLGMHDGSRRLYFGVEGDGDYFLGAGDTFHNTTAWSPAAGQVYDALLALDGSTARFYIDGAEVVSFAYGWTGTATRSIWLGARNHASDQTACDVKIYAANFYEGTVPTAALAAALSAPGTRFDLYRAPRVPYLPVAAASHIGKDEFMADSKTLVTASVTAENTGTSVLLDNTLTNWRNTPLRSIDLSITGTWSATVHLQRRKPGESTWRDVKVYTANAEEVVSHAGCWEYRLFCKAGNFTSGTIVMELSR